MGRTRSDRRVEGGGGLVVFGMTAPTLDQALITLQDLEQAAATLKGVAVRTPPNTAAARS